MLGLDPPKCVGGPLDGQTLPYRGYLRFVYDVHTGAPLEGGTPPPSSVPRVSGAYVLMPIQGDKVVFYAWAPEGWTQDEVLSALLVGYRPVGQTMVKNDR